MRLSISFHEAAIPLSGAEPDRGMDCGHLNSQLIMSTYNFERTVSVLGREEGYTVKYGLSPRAQAFFYRISRLES